MTSIASASILVVDDSTTMRAIVRDMLVRLGVRSIDEAESGAAALAKIRSSAYSVILSDLHMAPMDGLELLAAVRAVSKPGTNRFIFSTTERSWGKQTSAKMGGAEAYITKPFTIDVLSAKLQAVLKA